MAKANENQKFALCVENKDCEDLEQRKIYQILADDEAEKEGYLRVVDESGEDYLYPQSTVLFHSHSITPRSARGPANSKITYSYRPT